MLLSEKLYYFNKGGKHLNYTLFKLYHCLNFMCHTHQRNGDQNMVEVT